MWKLNEVDRWCNGFPFFILVILYIKVVVSARRTVYERFDYIPGTGSPPGGQARKSLVGIAIIFMAYVVGGKQGLQPLVVVHSLT